MCLYLVEHSHSRVKESHKFNNIHMLKEITKVCYAFQINSTHATKIKRTFIKAYNGARGHDNWGREEFLANVVLKSGNLRLSL